VVRVVLDEDAEDIWEIRWYTLMVLADEPVAAIFRIKLILKAEHRASMLAIALDDLFHSQALKTGLRRDGERQDLPPAGFYRPLRRAVFDGAVTCNLPLAWIVRRKENDIYWCSNDQYLGSILVYTSWTPVDLEEIDVEASVSASTQEAARQNLDGRDVGIDVKAAGARVLPHFTYDDDRDDVDPDDPDETPMRTHFWHVGQAVDGGILIAGFNLMVPLSHAEAPVFRDLVEDIDLSVRSATLSAPGPALPQPLPESAREFDMDQLRVHTCYDFINICVPRRWEWEEANDRGSFAAEDESEESGTFWVDYDFYRAPEGLSREAGVRKARESCECAAVRFDDEMDPTTMGIKDHADGKILWAISEPEERGERLRIYRFDYFLGRPRGLLIVHFNLVLLESQADEPEFVELVETMRREIEAARIL